MGSAIAASLAAAGVGAIGLFDVHPAAAACLGERLQAHFAALEVCTESADPAGFDMVVNATPLGMNDGDPLPMDVTRISPQAFVGEVVMKSEMTTFLEAAQAAGAATRWAPTCCSSRSPRTSNSSAFRARRPRRCASSPP